MIKNMTTTLEFIANENYWMRPLAVCWAICLLPTLAVTTSVINTLYISAILILIHILSAFLVTIVQRCIPLQVRPIIFSVIVATCVTTVDRVVAAYANNVYLSVGIYIQIFVVLGFIPLAPGLFTKKTNLLKVIALSLISAIAFSFCLIVLSIIREIAGSGTLGYLHIFKTAPLDILKQPLGAFLLTGLFLWIVSWFLQNTLKIKINVSGRFLSTLKNQKEALTLGALFTIALTGAVGLCLYSANNVLIPQGFSYLNILAFVTIISLLDPVILICRKRIAHKSSLPPSPFLQQNILAVLKSFILVVVLMVTNAHYTFVKSMAFALSTGLGLTLLVVVLISIRDKIAFGDAPRPSKGIPIFLVILAMILIAMSGIMGVFTK